MGFIRWDPTAICPEQLKKVVQGKRAHRKAGSNVKIGFFYRTF